jgi:hypothetical protein
MQPEFMEMPNTPEKWKEIAKVFSEKWKFPQCLGNIDGKHVLMLSRPAGLEPPTTRSFKQAYIPHVTHLS